LKPGTGRRWACGEHEVASHHLSKADRPLLSRCRRLGGRDVSLPRFLHDQLLRVAASGFGTHETLRSRLPLGPVLTEAHDVMVAAQLDLPELAGATFRELESPARSPCRGRWARWSGRYDGRGLDQSWRRLRRRPLGVVTEANVGREA